MSGKFTILAKCCKIHSSLLSKLFAGKPKIRESQLMISDDQFLAGLDDVKNQLYRFARGALYSKNDADDVFAEAVLSAWECREQFVEGSNFRAWLYQILINKIYSTNRRRLLDAEVVDKKKPNSPAAQRETEPPLTIERILSESHLATFMAENFEDDLQRALLTLNETERDTFLLLSLGGCSYSEIASITRAPIGTVVTRLTRARVKLRFALQQSDKQSEKSLKS